MRNKKYNISYTEDNDGLYYLCLNEEKIATIPKNINHHKLIDVIQNFISDYNNFNNLVIQNDEDYLGIIIDLYNDEDYLLGSTYWFEDFE